MMYLCAMKNTIRTGMLAMTPPRHDYGVISRVIALEDRKPRRQGEAIRAKENVNRPQEFVPVCKER